MGEYKIRDYGGTIQFINFIWNNKEIIFSERQSNFNFLNWKDGPFEVKQ